MRGLWLPMALAIFAVLFAASIAAVALGQHQ